MARAAVTDLDSLPVLSGRTAVSYVVLMGMVGAQNGAAVLSAAMQVVEREAKDLFEPMICQISKAEHYILYPFLLHT